ncbi:GtrA family protein [Pseudomonas proteolytica]|nr:GtrA family protein [Pseudomonas proteolytica]
MINLFSRYATIGVLNTAVHWAAFFGAIYLFGLSQSISNLCAFCIAVTFSFYFECKIHIQTEGHWKEIHSLRRFYGGIKCIGGRCI